MLDPACGTAGFLISSYKHILKANTDAKSNSTLTPDEKGRLAQNFKGYDISPDMVRLSLVNLYLHGFAAPHIYEYDTLTSQDRWNEYADVILANPPFMSPKGGIKPHNRFSVQSKRSEVLFVDYMAERLTPNGRAGIIVPEGIIFQGQTVYKQLRKMLVEEYLVAVVSLPAGVFNPYSGVKTSILILNKPLARKTSTIAFFKIENDGFGLGAQRREIDKNDRPQAIAEIGAYLSRLRAGESVDDFQPTLGLIVAKEKIAANGDYNLSGERFRENGAALMAFPYRTIKDIAVGVRAGFASGQSSVDTVGVPHVRPMNISEDGKFVPDGMKRISEEEFKGREDYALDTGDVLFNNTNSVELVGKTCIIESPLRGGFSNHMTRIRVNRDLCVPRFLALLLHSAWRKGQFTERATRWVGQAGINAKSLSEFQIPLPPLEVQKEIVAEIDGYQKVINGARVVLDNYRPHIPIHPDWPMVELGKLCKPEYGFTESAAENGDARFIRITDIAEDGTLRKDEPKFITLTDDARASLLAKGDLLVARTGATYGKTMLFEENYSAVFASYLIRLRFPEHRVHSRYYWVFAQSDAYWNQAKALMTGGGQPQFNGNALKQIKLPLPPLTTQQAIVAEIEAEQALVAANRELITRFEKKIQVTLARVWGEGKDKG